MKAKHQTTRLALATSPKENRVKTAFSTEEIAKRYNTENQWLTLPGILAGHHMHYTEALTYLCWCVREAEHVIRERVLPKAAPLSQAQWGEAFIIAKAVLKKECFSAVRDAEGEPTGFVLPLPGLAGCQRHYSIDLVAEVAAILFESHRAISEHIIEKTPDRELAVALSEALVIAEHIMTALHADTELRRVAGDFAEPSALQQQAWKLKAAALLSRS